MEENALVKVRQRLAEVGTYIALHTQDIIPNTEEYIESGSLYISIEIPEGAGMTLIKTGRTIVVPAIEKKTIHLVKE